MKLRKKLTVNGEPVGLIEEDVRLAVNSPGRAMFRVRAGAPLSGVVRFDIGYSTQAGDQRFFTGYVEASHTVDGAQQRLMCRELAAGLRAVLPLSLRHPTLKDVLAAYTEATGLVFRVPDRPYADRKAACFQTLGSGCHGMDSLGAVFGIEDALWQQQGDGSVYVGAWKDSRWATRPVTVEETWFSGVTGDGGRKLPALPALRPGVVLNGRRVRTLQFRGHEMVAA